MTLDREGILPDSEAPIILGSATSRPLSEAIMFTGFMIATRFAEGFTVGAVWYDTYQNRHDPEIALLAGLSTLVTMTIVGIAIATERMNRSSQSIRISEISTTPLDNLRIAAAGHSRGSATIDPTTASLRKRRRLS